MSQVPCDPELVDPLGDDCEAIAGFIPLIDVLFSILSAVMLLLALAATQAHVPIRLPELSGPSSGTGQHAMQIEIDASGQVRAGGRLLAPGNLATQLAPLLAGRHSLEVLIRADEQAPFGVSARLLQALRAVGCERVLVAALLHK